MIESIEKFFIGNWDKCLTILCSAIAVIVSIYTNLKMEKTQKQDMQDAVFEDIKRLLECKCNYFVSESKIIECYQEVMSISIDDEDKIKRNVYRWFGKKKYKQLQEILDLCQMARNIDGDIGEIFNALESDNPEKYSELQNILIKQEEYTYEQLPEENKKFLADLPHVGKENNYPEKSQELNNLDKQIRKKIDLLKNSLEKIMKR